MCAQAGDGSAKARFSLQRNEKTTDIVPQGEIPLRWVGWVRETPLVYLAALAVITLAAATVRFAHLGDYKHYDEAFTVWRYGTAPLTTTISNYSFPNNHIFHSVLVNASYRVWGSDEWVVRLPAYLAGVLLVPLGYFVFGRASSRFAGLLTAALVAGSSVLVGFSVNARGYTLAAALTLVCVAVASEIRRGHQRIWLALTIGGVAALGMWTVPVFVLGWTGVSLWLIAPGSLQRIPRRFAYATAAGVASVVGTLVLYFPVIQSDGVRVITSNKYVVELPLHEFARRIPGAAEVVWEEWTFGVPAVVVVSVAIGVLLAFISPWSRTRWLAWSALGGVAIVMTIQSSVPPPRVWLVILPLLIGIGASGLTSIPRSSHRLCPRSAQDCCCRSPNQISIAK
jgi:4-amino-4-deoxy-L-arabinose transferase-like glycosyltransferase